MEELKVTLNAINSNTLISDELKENIKELMTIFHQMFDQVDLTNFNERIKNLKIKKGSKFLIKTDVEYNPRENVLYINKDELEKSDAKHSLMMAMLAIITAKDNFYGLNDNGMMESLNIGIASIIANNLVGNECDIDE